MDKKEIRRKDLFHEFILITLLWAGTSIHWGLFTRAFLMVLLIVEGFIFLTDFLLYTDKYRGNGRWK